MVNTAHLIGSRHFRDQSVRQGMLGGVIGLAKSKGENPAQGVQEYVPLAENVTLTSQ